MHRALMSLITLCSAVIAPMAMAASDLPLVCEQNLVTGHRRCGISRARAREVIRFVRNVPGVSHQIISIDALDFPEVVVTTGESLEQGHAVYLRRVGRHWIVEKKVPWTKKDWIIMGTNRPNHAMERTADRCALNF